MEQRMPPIDISKIRPPKIPFRSLVSLAVLLFIVLIAWNLWFTVEPEEVGVVLRFGKFTREAQPGLNFKFPDPVETVIKIPVQRQLKEEFGFRTAPRYKTTGKYTGSSLRSESIMLTGDLNVVVVEWTSQFRITDPYKYLFKVKHPLQTFRDLNEAIMRSVVGDRTVNEVLTVGRQEIVDLVKLQLQDLCDQYETGMTVDQVVLRDVNPPDPVKPSFNEVNQAQQEKKKMINDALSEYNKIIPKAKGQALQTIQRAEGYAANRINQAKGDVAFFNAMLEAYKKAPDVTRQRLYLETLGEIYPNLQKKIIFDKKLEGILPLLPLNNGAKK